jgi:hypothetical protein
MYLVSIRIDPNIDWFGFKADRICHFLNPGETPPSMLYDRTDDEEMLTLPNSTTSEYLVFGPLFSL